MEEGLLQHTRTSHILSCRWKAIRLFHAAGVHCKTCKMLRFCYRNFLQEDIHCPAFDRSDTEWSWPNKRPLTGLDSLQNNSSLNGKFHAVCYIYGDRAPFCRLILTARRILNPRPQLHPFPYRNVIFHPSLQKMHS